MRAAKTARNLLEKRFHDFSEMLGFDHVEDLFEFIEEHDFLETACFGPELEQTQYDGLGQIGVFFDELNDAIGQLDDVKERGQIA